MSKVYGKLVVLRKDLTFGPYYPITNEVVFGRDKSCHIWIKLSSVSRFQAKITLCDKSGEIKCMINNLSKSNPTIVNSRVLHDNQFLLYGDTINIGDRFFIFQKFEAKDMRDMSKISKQRIEVTDADFKAKRADGEKFDAFMTVLEANGANGQQFYIPDELSIGRDPNCHVNLKLKDVSRIHATISKEGDNYFLNHLSKTNPTFVNGILAESSQRLFYEDKITVGDRSFIFSRVEAYAAAQEDTHIYKYSLGLKKKNPLTLRKALSPLTADKHSVTDEIENSASHCEETELMNKTVRVLSSHHSLSGVDADDIENNSPMRLIRSMLMRISKNDHPITADDVKDKVNSKIMTDMINPDSIDVTDVTAIEAEKSRVNLDMKLVNSGGDVRLSPLLQLRHTTYESPLHQSGRVSNRSTGSSSLSSRLNITNQELKERETFTNQIYSDICHEGEFGLDSGTFMDYCEHGDATIMRHDDILFDPDYPKRHNEKRNQTVWRLLRMFNCARVSLPLPGEEEEVIE